MQLSIFTTWAFLVSSFATAVQLPGLNGTFVERQVQHPNGSIVNVYLRDSYKPPLSDVDSLDKRFYETYHNGNHTEICAETNFVDTSTLESALCSDCSAIITELKANPGFFETGDYMDSEYSYLTVCGTCAFGVHRTDGLSSRVDIGSKDVIDNINSAIIRFPVDDHVGATGNFTCNSAPINWAILKAS
ncbi:putative necrosis-inducing factor-domain-containing protein [Annulohypoxylon truncatum]|uniref:putative necrosis-inducing factor-domain-containing protein n=1 Tax=Annulohypoxylon truncatum TaxID=327061 RepID=UPI0020072496|nr:putative necrosis-inducing factor-domain-containing protein [Annulohypoxylon truncatum]KAI1205790.1 putative necrosis-inducing factor-domain-containing protein [Annulohypoxylon truncatum]